MSEKHVNFTGLTLLCIFFLKDYLINFIAGKLVCTFQVALVKEDLITGMWRWFDKVTTHKGKAEPHLPTNFISRNLSSTLHFSIQPLMLFCCGRYNCSLLPWPIFFFLIELSFKTKVVMCKPIDFIFLLLQPFSIQAECACWTWVSLSLIVRFLPYHQCYLNYIQKCSLLWWWFYLLYHGFHYCPWL